MSQSTSSFWSQKIRVPDDVAPEAGTAARARPVPAPRTVRRARTTADRVQNLIGHLQESCCIPQSSLGRGEPYREEFV
jgi:hypothetical protein